MSMLTKSLNTIVLPNRETIKIAPDNILYETIVSREKAGAGNVSFLVQNKGQDSLLDAVVYLEVPVTLTKYNSSNATANFADEDKIAIREPFSIIRNSVFVWNGTSITAQPSITSDVYSVIFDNDETLNKYVYGGYSNPTWNNSETASDLERLKRVRTLEMNGKPADNTASTFNTTVLVPLQFPPFHCGRTDYQYSGMSPTLPFVNNSELQLQFHDATTINNLGFECCSIHDQSDGSSKSDWYVKANFNTNEYLKLYVKWYSLPSSIKLNDVYDISSWSEDFIFANEGKVGGVVADGTKTNTYERTYLARIQQKPDYILIFAGIDKTDTGATTGLMGTGCFPYDSTNQLLRINSVEITVDNDSGSFTKTISGKVLRNLTSMNLNNACRLGDYAFENYKNFVFLTSEQISTMTRIPAGVFANSTISANVIYSRPLNQANVLNVSKNYDGFMVLISKHNSLRVTRDSVEAIRNGITQQSFQASGTGGGVSTGGGIGVGGRVKMTNAYRSRL